MPSSATTLSVFGLDNVLVDLQGKPSIGSCRPKTLTNSLFRASVGDKNSVTVVISNQDQSRHTDTWMWLLKHFKVVGGPQPTYLLMRVGDSPTTVSAIQNLKVMLSRYPACTRIQCLDSDESVLSSYRDFIRNRNILFWDLSCVKAGSISTFDSSFITRS